MAPRTIAGGGSLRALVALGGLVGLASLGLAGCRITPDEIARIETENELLRQQIRVMRESCDPSRSLRLDVEPERREEAPDARPDDAAGPQVREDGAAAPEAGTPPR